MVVIGGMRSFLGPGARRLVLHPVPRVPVDLDAALAVLVRPPVRRLHRVLADRPRRRGRPADRAVSRAAWSRRPRWPGARIADGRAAAAALSPLRAASDGPVLVADGLVKQFGGIHAVDGVTFAVKDRTLHALIGPNGAGKTTAFNLVSGLYPPDRGTIELEGRSIAGLKPERHHRGRRRPLVPDHQSVRRPLGRRRTCGSPCRRAIAKRFAVWRSTAALDRRERRDRRADRLSRPLRHRARGGRVALLWRAAPARPGRRARDPPAHPAARRAARRAGGGRAAARRHAGQDASRPKSRCCSSSTTSIACSRSPTTSP